MANGKRMSATPMTAAQQHDEDESHGHSVAAWVLVGIVLVGALISAFSMVLNHPTFFIVGLVVMVVGLIVGKVLQSMGYGADKVIEKASPRNPDRPQGIK